MEERGEGRRPLSRKLGKWKTQTGLGLDFELVDSRQRVRPWEGSTSRPSLFALGTHHCHHANSLTGMAVRFLGMGVPNSDRFQGKLFC